MPKNDPYFSHYATREEMRELDRQSIEEYKIPSILLMENAGAGAARIIARREEKGPIAIFCGPGNNGGDGFVVARHLYNSGREVEVFFVGDMAKIPPMSDPGIHLTILQKMHIPITQILREKDLANLVFQHPPQAIVDALLGTGLMGPVRSPIAEAIRKINAYGLPIVALDLPSGLDANSGEILGAAIQASYTITFALPKKGFLLKQGPSLIGEVFVVEISIPRNLLEKK